MRTAVHAWLPSTLLLAVVAWPSASFGVVACDAAAVRVLAGCNASGSCTIPGTLDIVCDASCGAECFYDFAGGEHTLRGTIRSTGPAMRFRGEIFWIWGPKGGGPGGNIATRVPGIVGPLNVGWDVRGKGTGRLVRVENQDRVCSLRDG